MLDGLLCIDVVTADEILIGHICRIRLESIQIRNIPLDESFEKEAVYKESGIGDDAGKEVLISLIALQLLSPECLSGDIDRKKIRGVIQIVPLEGQFRDNPYLPPGRQQFLRHENVERQFHHSVPFGDLISAADHPGGPEFLCRNHLACRRIQNGIHQSRFY